MTTDQTDNRENTHTQTLDTALWLKNGYDTLTVCYLKCYMCKNNLKCMFFVNSQAYSSIWVMIRF